MQSGAVAATQLRIMITPTKNNKDHGFARCFTKNKCYPVKVILHLRQLAKAKVVFKEETKRQIAFCIIIVIAQVCLVDRWLQKHDHHIWTYFSALHRIYLNFPLLKCIELQLCKIEVSKTVLMETVSPFNNIWNKLPVSTGFWRLKCRASSKEVTSPAFQKTIKISGK